MSGNEPTVESPVEPPGDAPSVGRLLREAREESGQSAADVARQLRLGLKQIEALEADRFDILPGNTIVRGFIRNYAKLLQRDPAPFLAAYEGGQPSLERAKITAPAENIDISPHSSRRWLWYVGGTIALVLGAPLAIYLLLHDDGIQRAPVAVKTPQAVPSQGGQVSLSVALPAAPPTLTQSVPPAPEPAASAAPSAPQTAAEAPKPAVQAGASIQMTFDEDAWVEILDRSGKKIFSQLNRKGAVEAVSGDAPFSLVIGNAAKVHLTYKGKAVDLQPYVKVNVARLTLE